MHRLTFAALAVLLTASAPAAPPPAVNSPAPGFTLMDSNGKKHSLQDFQGKYVVLEWVNYDCPFVRKHYKSGNMQKIQQTYSAKDVVWLSICSSAPDKQGYFEGEDLTDRIKTEKAVPTAYLVDPEGTVGRLYDAKTTPHMFVINPKGILVYAGAIDDMASTDVDDIAKSKNYVAAALDAAMSGKAPATSSSKPYGCSVKYK
jgi:peroxiredoxin